MSGVPFEMSVPPPSSFEAAHRLEALYGSNHHNNSMAAEVNNDGGENSAPPHAHAPGILCLPHDDESRMLRVYGDRHPGHHGHGGRPLVPLAGSHQEWSSGGGGGGGGVLQQRQKSPGGEHFPCGGQLIRSSVVTPLGLGSRHTFPNQNNVGSADRPGDRPLQQLFQEESHLLQLQAHHAGPRGDDSDKSKDVLPADGIAPEEVEEEEERLPRELLGEFLSSLSLTHLLDVFQAQDITYDVLPLLTDDDLSELGVTSLTTRQLFIKAARSPKSKSQNNNNTASSSPQKKKLKNTTTTNTTIQMQLGFGGRLEKPPLAPPQAQPAAAAVATTTNNNNKKTNTSQQPPPWCMPLDGTRVVVDCFQAKHRRWLKAHFGGTQVTPLFFLTHFHSDHYGGLTKGFNEGTIYCTHATAQLVTRKVGVNASYVRTLPLDTPTPIDDGITVTLVDANHCPGAAMLLFRLPSGRLVLHTGDMRYDATAFQANAHLAAAAQASARGTRMRVVLDTTYAEPKHTFAPQRELVEYVVSAVQMETFRSQSTLFLFGTYALGKERVVREVAQRLGRKVCVTNDKKLVWDCVFGSEEKPWWTTNAGETNLHVCPIWRLNFKNLAAELKSKRHTYSTVVAFAPTGWALGGKPGQAAPTAANNSLGVTREQKGSAILYRVPYSEHSSFPELRAFLQWLKPSEVLPHVGNDGAWKMQRMIRALVAPETSSKK
ncbi:DNA cross-link repair 1A protein [Pseudoscourfieldia marina]